jgi:hypothetical protein
MLAIFSQSRSPIHDRTVPRTTPKEECAMPYDPKDPRASLMSPAAAEPKAPTDFAGADYVKFNELAPDETAQGVKTWYGRGQHMVIAYTEASEGTSFSRSGQPDEYVLLLPDREMAVEVTTGNGTEKVDGFTISIIPPGDSSVRALAKGRFVRLFTVRSEDLAKKCSNAASYASPHPNVASYEAWPAPVKGYLLRTYSLDVPPQEGRFGRIWRCSTFMVNYLDRQFGPRDATKMSPHVHDDFEQCSLAVEGVFVHHLRWPWTTNMNKWRPDEHEVCGTPSIAILPPAVIHTTRASAEKNQLVDIFCPPRADFSQKPGWVLNADEYPMP